MSGFVNPWNDFSTKPENLTDKTHNTPLITSQTVETTTDKTPAPEGFVTYKTPESAETSQNLKAPQPYRDDLLARAETLITLYGPLKVDSGQNGCATGVVNPETLVKLYLKWPWGIVGTQNRVALMKWGTPPAYAYEGWSL